MTPNEARKVLASYPREAARRDVLGKVARQDIREAYRTLARHSLDIANRVRSPAKTAAYLDMAGFYRTAAEDVRP